MKRLDRGLTVGELAIAISVIVLGSLIWSTFKANQNSIESKYNLRVNENIEMASTSLSDNQNQ